MSVFKIIILSCRDNFTMDYKDYNHRLQDRLESNVPSSMTLSLHQPDLLYNVFEFKSLPMSSLWNIMKYQTVG